jgi:tRNA-binding protein
MSGVLDLAEFQRVELHAGTIVRAETFPEARRPAFRLWIDLGQLGVRTSSAQITDHYHVDSLMGRQVLCVTNLKPRRIAGFVSEVLVTGFVGSGDGIVLAVPERSVPNGARLC